MNISIAGQTLEFLYAALLGVFLSTVYDLLKVPRLRTKYFTALFDALFCIIAAVSVFLFFMTVGGGEIRIYYLIGAFGGGIIYFLTLSSVVLELGGMFADLIKLVFTVLITPALLLAGLVKKIIKILQNVFKYFSKWYRIEETNKNIRVVRLRSMRLPDGGSLLEKKKSRIADKNRSAVVGSLRSRDPYISPEANQ